MENSLTNNQLPILYSFRRCPYAMRARMALHYAKITYRHREIELKNKPTCMLEYSPKGTVPVLIIDDNTVIDESLDIVKWAINYNPSAELELIIKENDSQFKYHLDRYKYPNRYNCEDEIELHKNECIKFIKKVDVLLENNPKNNLSSQDSTMLNIIIFPFIRQFLKTDEDLINQLQTKIIQQWFTNMSNSELFLSIMEKYPLYSPGNTDIEVIL